MNRLHSIKRATLILLLLALNLPLHADTFADRSDRILDWVNSNWPNVGQYGGPHRIGRIGFWYVEGRLLRNQTNSTTWSILTDAIRNADGYEDAGGANGGFSGWPGMDCYLRWNQLMPQSLKDQYYTEYTTMGTYKNGSTANQLWMWATACRLACETWGTENVTQFSNANFTKNGGGDPSGRYWLMYQMAWAVRNNFIEHNASHYFAYSLGPVRSLADLSTDLELKQHASMTWDWAMANAAPYWLNGHACVTSSRGRVNEIENRYDITDFTWWLMFGGPVPYSMLDSEQSLLNTQPQFPGLRPEFFTAGTDRSQPYVARSMARVHENYFKQSYMTPKYGIFSQAEAWANLNGDNSIKITSMSAVAEYQAERWGLAWDDPGNGDSALTIHAKTVYGTATGGIGAYEYTLQCSNTLISVLDIPTNGVQNLACHVPNTGVSASINESSSGRLYLHYPSVLVALTVSKAFNWSASDFGISFSTGGYAVETAEVSEYPQATASARLAAFRSDILAHGGFNTNYLYDATNRLIYTNRFGTVLDQTYAQIGKVNGEPLNYEAWPLNESPWTYQQQAGNLFVFATNRTLLWNYKNWTQATNNRPTVITSTSFQVSNGTPVDVNLATRVSDIETISTNLVFRILNATNGSAQLLADGRTVRFTPAADFKGAGSFTFAADDRFPHAKQIFHYDFEQANPTSGNRVADASTQERKATVDVVGLASLAGDTNTPPALSRFSTQSLRFSAAGVGAARLSRQVYPANLTLANEDWTFATWVNRASYADDDFVFYVGNSDGHSGGGDELELYCPAQSKTIAVRHYNTGNATDVILNSAATVGTNEWHHVALTFQRTGHNTGHVRLYVDGVLSGTASNVTWALNQTGPVYLGGPAVNAVFSRCFNGLMDDIALWRDRFDDGEIARLATGPAAALGGLEVTNTVSLLTVPLTPLGLTAGLVGNGIALSWTPAAGASSYAVKRATIRTGPFTNVASGLTAANWTDTSASPGVNYFYVVNAANVVGTSPDSAAVSAMRMGWDVSLWEGSAFTAWSHGTRLTFPGYTRSETLTNIPLLVTLSTNIPGFSYTNFAMPSGGDLRFTDETRTNELPYEVEQWNTNGSSLVWVRVPLLTTNTTLQMFWGKAGVIPTALPNTVSNLALWLKADALALTDGQTVSTWTDSSTNARHATLTAGTPQFKTNVLNGRPVVRFPTDGNSTFTFPTMTNIRTAFWVVKESANGLHFLIGDDVNYHFHRGLNGEIFSGPHISANIKNGTTRLMGAVVNATNTLLGSGFRVVSVVTTGNVEASTLCKDRALAGRSWDGDIAEVIIYDRALTSTEEAQVGGYLAQKYALPTSYDSAPPAYALDGSTWSNGFVGVWHLDSTSATDDSPKAHHASANTATATTGIVFGGLNYSGSAQTTTIPYHSDFDRTGNYLLEGWFKLNAADKPAANDYRVLTSKQVDLNNRNWWISVRNDGSLWWKGSSGLDVTATGDWANGQWHHFAALNNGDAAARLYVDGVQQGVSLGAGFVQVQNAPVYFGSELGNTRFFKGPLDEFRISNTGRSTNWVWATYRNIAANGSFNSLAPVVVNAPDLALVATLPASGVTSTTATLNGDLLNAGSSPPTVTVYWGATDAAVNAAGWSNSIALGSRTAGEFSTNVTGLLPGVTNHFRCYATNASGGNWAGVSQMFITPPVPPAGLAGVPGNGLVRLTWPTVAGVATYQIQRATVSGGPYTALLGGVVGTNFTDVTAVIGTTYYYVVNSENAGGPGGNSPELALLPVAAPTALIASPTNAGVALTWTASPGATSYNVKRATNSAGPFATIQSNLVATSYSESGLVNGTTYFYVVSANSPGFESLDSALAGATPLATLPVPTGLVGFPANGAANLAWNSVSGATGYRIKRATVSGGPYANVASGLLSPTYGNTGLVNGTPYYFVVSALFGTSESSNSLEVVVTPAVPPTIFTNVTAGAWDSVTWLPNPPGKPIADFTTTLVFSNTAPIASTNDLDVFLFKALQLNGAAVTLTGDPFFISGSGASIATVQNAAHTIANSITLDSQTTVSVPANTLTLSGAINGDSGITKTGAGTLLLAGTNSFTGDLTLEQGTMRMTATHSGLNSLTFGASAGSTNYAALQLTNASLTAVRLTVQNNHATANTVTISAGRTLTINNDVLVGTYSSAANATTKLTINGGGTLDVNGGSDSFRLGTTTGGSGVSATVDLSALANFSLDYSGGDLTLGNSTVGGTSANTLILATNSTVAVGAINLGDNQVVGSAETLKLGAGTNYIFTDKIELGTGANPSGGGRGIGVVQFNGSSGALILRDLAGGGGPDINFQPGGSSGNGYGTIDLNGHYCDLKVNTLSMADTTTATARTHTFNFNNGLLDIRNVNLGVQQGSGAQTCNLNLGGGSVTLGSNDPDDPGSVSLATDANGVLNLTGGTVTLFSDILRNTGTGTATLNLNGAGAVLDLNGFNIGDATRTIGSFTFTAGTLRNLGTLFGNVTLSGTGARMFVQDTPGTVLGVITGSAGLTKAGADTLLLSGANNYTGGSIVSSGTLTLSGTNTFGASSITVGNVASNAVLNINGSANITSSGTSGNAGLLVGNAINANGAVNLSAGSLTLSPTTDYDLNLALGATNNSYGYINMSGGTLSTKRFTLGGFSTTTPGNGVAVISGGTATVTGYLIIGRVTGANGSLTVASGGTLNHLASGGGAAGNGIALAYTGGRGELNLTGGLLDSTGQSLNYNNANSGTATGIVNLNSGKLIVNSFLKSGGSASAFLNFNGSMLKASSATATFIPATMTAVNVFSGGATIDDGGNAITIPAALVAPGNTGVTGISMTTGPGVNKGSNYIGAPYVSITGGTRPANGSPATAIANMADDGTGKGTLKVDGITITCPGLYTDTSTLAVSFIGGGGSGAVAGTISSAANTSGGLIKLGTNTLTLSAVNTYSGGTTVSNGTLVASTNGVLGTGNLTVASNAVCSLQNPLSAIADAADVRLNGVLNLAAGVNETVARLFINGVEMLGGTWNAARDPVHFTGAGNLIVANSGVSPTPPQLTSGHMSSNRFQVQVSGTTGYDYTVQASTNLVTWTSLFMTNPVTMPFSWTDLGTTNFPRRFYRVLLGP